MRTLVIVESPAKCKKIMSYLGKGYVCIASFGHIREFKNGLKSIDYKNDYHPTFKISSNKTKYVKNIKNEIKKASEVILATDDDREGEAIAWHICQVFNLPIATTKRIIFHEITKPAILNAVQNPTTIDMNKVSAQLARQIIDLMVGFTITPVLWKHITWGGKDTKLSAGRCQIPALRIIYDNQKLIEKNPGRKVYETKGYFLENMEFLLNHNHKDENKMGEFLEENVDFEHKLSVSKKKEVFKKPPLPLITSTLQQKASNECNFSPKQTMKLAQTLYENGLITYMRTDSKKYSKEFVNSTASHIHLKYGEKYIHSNIKSLINKTSTVVKTSAKKSKGKETSKKSKGKDKKNLAQEAHEAIRPTDIKVTTPIKKGKITNREIKLYKLIWATTMESCMSDAIYNQISASISAPDEYVFKTTTEEVKFPGWKIVKGYEKNNEEYRKLRSLKDKKESDVDYSKMESKLTLKNLKKNYTEAKLIQTLEKKGIGRPSTYSSLISKIQERKYVLKQDVPGRKIECLDFRLIGNELEEYENTRVFGNEKNKLVIQQIGIVVLEFLIKYFDDMFQYDYTKNMEDALDIVAKGNRVWYDLCNDCNVEMKKNMKNIKDKHKETIRIDENHTYMIGKYGPVIKHEKDGVTEFITVRKDIDMEKLKNKEYRLEEIIYKKPENKPLGNYKDHPVYLKNGKFGLYVSYKSKNYSVKSHIGNKKQHEIKLDDVIPALSMTKTSSVLKILSDDVSIRSGKFGPYVFYKTKNMTKPKFKSLKGVKVQDVTLEWVNKNLYA